MGITTEGDALPGEEPGSGPDVAWITDLNTLRDFLEREGIRRGSYAIGRGKFPSEAYVLYHDSARVIAYSERGQTNPYLTFASEAEACQWMARELMTDPVPCWFFVDTWSTDDQAREALARWVAERGLPAPTEAEVAYARSGRSIYLHGKYVRRHHLHEWGRNYLNRGE